MKELTFKEVIANIKEGEEWESDFIEIKKVKEGIAIYNKEDYGISYHLFTEETKYKLKRKEHDFTEAFKAYEEGKEIESKNGRVKYIKILGKDVYKDIESYDWISNNSGFEIEEIRGAWYINDR